MSVFDPHNPYEDYPTEMLDYVDAEGIPRPLRRPEGEKRPRGILRERNHSYLGGFDRFTEDDFHKMRLGYFASIALFDQEVGRVLQALEESGRSENTLVIMTSDHGDMLGDQELLVKGGFFYDPCVKTPLIMRWPGRIPAGKRSEELVQIHDLAATALSAAGFTGEELRQWMPESLDLTAVACGSKGHEQAVCCYRNSGISDQGEAWNPPLHCTMFRDSRFKLNVYHGERFGELYDMGEDPRELHNLWDSPHHREVRLELTEKLVEWMLTQELSNDARGGQALPDPRKRLVNALK
jgi:arylsulfatase A-like enzyme